MSKFSKNTLIAFALLAFLVPITNAGELILTVPVGEYHLEQTENASEHRLYMDGYGTTTDKGAPWLPSRIFPVALPPGTIFQSLEVRAERGQVINGTWNISPKPAPRPITDSNSEVIEHHQKEYDDNYAAIYGQGAVYPEAIAEFVRSGSFRKYNLADIRVTPVQYDTTTKNLTVFNNIEIVVRYIDDPSLKGTGYKPINDNSPRMEAQAEQMILNYQQAQNWYGRTPRTRGLHEFVIITTNALISSVQPLIDIEETKGRTTYIATVEWINSNYSGRDLEEKMRTFLRDKYPTAEWGITDVCLVGHHSDVPMREVDQDLGYGKPLTDFYFAELSNPDSSNWDSNNNNRWWDSSDNADYYNEVNVGRIPWSNATTVNAICQKSANFELIDDPSFKESILFLGGFFWENTDNAVLMEAIAAEPWMSSWNQYRMYEQNGTVYSTYPCDQELTHNNVRSAWPIGTYCFVD